MFFAGRWRYEDEMSDVTGDSAGRSLGVLAAALKVRKLPPVHLWNPERCGDSEMRIAVDGTWFHQGSPIGRKELVQLFSTILRREADGSFVLVTPHEKLDIAVDDAPFLAVAVMSEGVGAARRLVFRLNTEEMMAVGASNPLRIETAADGTPRPYVMVRDGLEALVARSVFYELVDWALAEDLDRPDSGQVGLWSDGVFFAFGAAG